MDSNNDQQAIEQEFLESWDYMEVYFYQTSDYPSWKWLKSILKLIAELRVRGYDKKFRAGQSMVRFQLSRSREHGLRRGQSMLGFDILREGGMHVIYFETSNIVEVEVDRVVLTPEVDELLTRLLSHPID